MLTYKEITNEIASSDLNNNLKNIIKNNSKVFFNTNFTPNRKKEKYNSDENIIKEIDGVSEELGLFVDGKINYNFILKNNYNNNILKKYSINELKNFINKLANKEKLNNEDKILKDILIKMNLYYKDNLNYNKDIVKVFVSKYLNMIKNINKEKYDQLPISQW